MWCYVYLHIYRYHISYTHLILHIYINKYILFSSCHRLFAAVVLFDDGWLPADGLTDSQLTGPCTGTELAALAYAAPPRKETLRLNFRETLSGEENLPKCFPYLLQRNLL